ncbi:MAG: hypothetical protein LC750_11420 [Actinobacteria bacterium]|nr:hypothetical protein [Actinomycetota bacterium]
MEVQAAAGAQQENWQMHLLYVPPQLLQDPPQWPPQTDGGQQQSQQIVRKHDALAQQKAPEPH